MRFVSRAIRARIGFSPSKIQKCANRRYWTADLLPKQAMVLENEKNPCFGDPVYIGEVVGSVVESDKNCLAMAAAAPDGAPPRRFNYQ